MKVGAYLIIHKAHATAIGWAGLGLTRTLFGTISCLSSLRNKLSTINSCEALSLYIIRMERLIATI